MPKKKEDPLDEEALDRAFGLKTIVKASEIPQNKWCRVDLICFRRVDGILAKTRGLFPVKELPDVFNQEIRPVNDETIILQKEGTGMFFRADIHADVELAKKNAD